MPLARQVPAFVGLKPEKEQVCRLLMKGALRDGMTSWIWLSGWDKADYHLIPDASGAGNPGFLAGGTWSTDDLRGKVLELDGKHDRVEINNSPELNLSNGHPNRTIAFWMRAKKTTPADPLDALDAKAKKPAPTPQMLYEEGGSGAGINVYLEGDTLLAGSWGPSNQAWIRTKLASGDSWETWHHVTLVLHEPNDKATELVQTLYIDGKPAAEKERRRGSLHIPAISMSAALVTQDWKRARPINRPSISPAALMIFDC